MTIIPSFVLVTVEANLKPLLYWFEATPGEWSTCDKRSINRTFSGLTKLIF